MSAFSICRAANPRAQLSAWTCPECRAGEANDETLHPSFASTEAQKIPWPPARCLRMHGPRNAAIGRAAGTGSSVADAVSRPYGGTVVKERGLTAICFAGVGAAVVAAGGAVRAVPGFATVVMLIFGGWLPQDLCSSHVRCL